jgi:hypothetical protein
MKADVKLNIALFLFFLLLAIVAALGSGFSV